MPRRTNRQVEISDLQQKIARMEFLLHRIQDGANPSSPMGPIIRQKVREYRARLTELSRGQVEEGVLHVDQQSLDELLGLHLKPKKKKATLKEKCNEYPQAVKYPRTLHLPWSAGRGDDDKVMVSDKLLREIAHDREVVVTVKMDGENTTLYRDYLHARSLNSKSHPSRDMLKAMHAGMKHLIPEGMRVCGENMFAKHSIHYKNLSDLFLVHSIWFKRPHSLLSANDMCLSWDETVGLAGMMGLKTVPVLYRGPYDPTLIKSLYRSEFNGDEMEGYVVRLADPFPLGDFRKCVGKYVRKGHVQTEDHWMHSEIVRNKVKGK